MSVLINIVAFQIGWFACVLSAANGRPWVGTLIALGIVTAHLFRAQQPQKELALVLSAALIGLVWDSLLVLFGWLDYPSGILVYGTAPYWIIAMWMIFATTINVSLRWLKGQIALSALLGAIAGPFAYWAGSQLGGVWMVEPLFATVALALGWATAMPLLISLSDHFDGVQLRPAQS